MTDQFELIITQDLVESVRAVMAHGLTRKQCKVQMKKSMIAETNNPHKRAFKEELKQALETIDIIWAEQQQNFN